MLLQSLYLTGLAEAAPVKVVPLHGDGSYMGYNFCGNFTGVPEAAGQKVSGRVAACVRAGDARLTVPVGAMHA